MLSGHPLELVTIFFVTERSSVKILSSNFLNSFHNFLVQKLLFYKTFQILMNASIITLVHAPKSASTQTVAIVVQIH